MKKYILMGALAAACLLFAKPTEAEAQFVYGTYYTGYYPGYTYGVYPAYNYAVGYGHGYTPASFVAYRPPIYSAYYPAYYTGYHVGPVYHTGFYRARVVRGPRVGVVRYRYW